MSIAALGLSGDPTNLKISATDVASSGSCARQLAVKIRPDIQSSAWRRSYGSESTFVLGIVAKLVLAAHYSAEANDPADLARWIRDELDRRRVLPLLRPYATTAVTNVLEAHWDIEDEIGALALIQNDPAIGRRPKTLWAWGPLYGTVDGIREIRRYRLGSAHAQPDEKDLLWTHTAARIAAAFPADIEPSRIRVVEVGAGDGSLTVVFDDTPAAATDLFSSHAKGVAGALGDVSVATPGFACSNCKVAGVCDGLIPVSELLGQPTKGYASRSVAPSDLDRYAQCPAQWLLAADLHLPRVVENTEAQTRGLLVHQWLELAHNRGHGCSEADLPVPGEGVGLASGFMDAKEYSTAYPFLRSHVTSCPLSADEVKLVEAESLVHGYDAAADVVTVTKPDLVFRVADRVVIREFKTSSNLPAGGSEEIYDKYLQVPFMISMLAAGVQEAYGASTATVEVEVLTPETSEVYAWDLEDPDLVESAKIAVKVAASQWHTDSEWKTNPGIHCTWCPVRKWCPDGHAFESSPKVAVTGPGIEPIFDPEDDPPPF